MTDQAKQVVLVILDGWGYSENPKYNAIANAKKPVWDRLWNQYPHTLIAASGEPVGLPEGQMGNSEVGHLTIGAGRVLYQDYLRVNRAIERGEFNQNPALLEAIEKAKVNQGAVHVMGLLSPGGVHSHELHLQAMMRLAVEQGVKNVYLHAFLDGRDTPPKSAKDSLLAMEKLTAELDGCRIASICGRFFAMDRDQRWDRVKEGFDLVAHGVSAFQAEDSVAALELAYQRDETDEFVAATAIVGAGDERVKIQPGDAVIHMNFRADRARELTQSLTETEFDRFDRGDFQPVDNFVCLTEFKESFGLALAFPPVAIKNGFGQVLADLGKQQLRMAETEKFAHVTFFFNGGADQPWPGEERVLIPSPDVKTYDLQPEMSAPEVTTALLKAIGSKQFDAIVCNYANSDMVGHTGDYDAAVKGIEALDACLEQVVEGVLNAGVELLITADHGNSELMFDDNSQQPHTAHTSNLVPLIYIGGEGSLQESGSLADIAPTLLALMGMNQPKEMTGRNLIERQ